MATVTVYTTDRCAYCERTKALLNKRGIEFQEINLARDPDGRDALVAKTGNMTFPQVLIGDEVVGGWNETSEADRSGRLAELAAAA